MKMIKFNSKYQKNKITSGGCDQPGQVVVVCGGWWFWGRFYGVLIIEIKYDLEEKLNIVIVLNIMQGFAYVYSFGRLVIYFCFICIIAYMVLVAVYRF